MPSLDFREAQGALTEEQNQTAKFDINVIVIPPGPSRQEQHARMLWEFSSRMFTKDQASSLTYDYAMLLDAALQAPGKPVSLSQNLTRDAPTQDANPGTTPSLASATRSINRIEDAQILQDIFSRVLGCKSLQLDCSQKDKGCHSFSAVRTVALFEEKTGKFLTLRTIFETPKFARFRNMWKGYWKNEIGKRRD